MRYAKMPSWAALAMFLPLVAGAIVAGPYVPFDLAATHRAGADGRAARRGACCCWPTAWWRACCRCGCCCSRAGSWAGTFCTRRWRRGRWAWRSAACKARVPDVSRLGSGDGRRRDRVAVSDAVHHDRLRGVLGVSLADRQRHDVEAAAPRDRRQAGRLRRDAARGDGGDRVAVLRDDVRRGVAATRGQEAEPDLRPRASASFSK